MIDRAIRLKQSLVGNESPDDIMMLIMETFSVTELIPEVGKYYTFVYKPKTPNIQYDEYPIVACLDVKPWGFKAINFHWGDVRYYTWTEVVGYLHVVETHEFKTLRSIPFAQYNINN